MFVLATLAGGLPAAPNTAVVISELGYHPAVSEDDEFIELHNTSGDPVDVSGWFFANGVQFAIPPSTGIAPGGFLVIARNSAGLLALHAALDAALVVGDYAGLLDNDGEELTLRDRDGRLVDRIAYRDDKPWPENPDGLGPSIERTDFTADGEQQWVWQASIVAGGTPGARNSTLPGGPVKPPRDVEINEVVAGAVPGASYIELHNEGAVPADLSGYRLVDRPSGVSGYIFPAGTGLAPGAFLAAGGDLLPFAVTDGAQWFGLLAPGGEFVDGLRTRARPAGRPFGRWPDGDGDTFVLDEATRETANRLTPETGVVINEIRYNPPLGHSGEEYIELFNRGGTVIDLSGWTLAGAVRYAAPEGMVLVPGAYLVVSGDPAAVETAYGIDEVAGPWSGRLANSDERIELLDALGNRADVVHYADGGTWPASDDVAQTGPDGYGQSIELVNPDMENNHGVAWQAAAGTPGAANSAHIADPAPVIRSPAHSPAQPRATDPVTVTARIEDALGVAGATVFFRVDGATSFTQAVMARIGPPSSDTYSAALPARPSGTIVQFYVSAVDTTGRVRTCPAAAPDRVLLYQVDDDAYPGGLPLYRLVMRDADLTTLATRAVTSDVLLPGTFIHKDDVYYDVGVRYRGENSRYYVSKAFRVQFTHEERFEGTTRLNLNVQDIHRAFVGLDFLRRADIPSPQTRPAAFVVNRLFGDAVPANTSIRYGGIYQRMEAVDEDFLSREFPGDDDGNLYRPVVTSDGSGNLTYLGEDRLEDYQERYIKITNTIENDYTDIIELTRILNETPAEEYVQALEAALDVDEWVRYFAAELVLSNQDGQIATSAGEDYRLYRRFSDGRWVILPWDTNEVMYTNPAPYFFRMTSAAVLRFLRHPAFMTRYFGAIREQLDGPFTLEAMTPCIDAVRPWFDDDPLDYMVETFIPESQRLFRSRLVPDRLTIEVSAGTRTLVGSGAAWRFFRGDEEPPAAWAERTFDDASWEEGPAPIGYGEAEIATVLADMRDNYTTVYIRRRFAAAGPDAFRTLTLTIDYDDAFVAYLNGAEVARRNFTGDVTHTSVADTSHESGTPAVIDISAFRDGLVAGDNVIAIVGLNQVATSGDLVLDPLLSAEDATTGAGCFGRLLAGGDPVPLRGEAPICFTAAVLVNGERAAYDAAAGRWSYDAYLGDAGGEVAVEALDWRGTVIAAADALVEMGGSFTSVAGTVGTTRWPLDDSPYLVTGDLTVPLGSALTIDPGVRVFLEGGASIIIRGTLNAAGTEALPIAFQAASCDGAWGALQCIGASARGLLEHAEMTYAQGITGGRGAVVASQGAQVVLRSCVMADLLCAGIAARDGATRIEVYDSAIERAAGGVACDAASALLERVRIADLPGASIGIHVLHESDPPSEIRDCILGAGIDTGILLEGASARIEGASVHGTAGSGLRVTGACAPAIARTLVWGCRDGLACESGAAASVTRCTIAANAVGLYLHETDAGAGGGHAAADSLIVWDNGVTALADPYSTLAVEWSDVEGGYDGTNNLSFDPLFVDAAGGDFRLQPISPAIGAGKDGVDMGALPSIAAGEAPFMRGDANADGRTDISDAVTVLRHLFAGYSSLCLDAHDANDDGRLDIADAVALLGHLFASQGPLPAPFGACGADPTLDALGCGAHAPCP